MARWKIERRWRSDEVATKVAPSGASLALAKPLLTRAGAYPANWARTVVEIR